jgi:hypothetical protein
MKSWTASYVSFAFALATLVGSARTVSAAAPVAARKSPALLTGIPEDKLTVRKPALERDAIRRRFVRVAPDDLKRLSSLTALRLELFDDRKVEARLLQVRGRGDRGFTWFGLVPGEEIGDVILTVVDGVMMGTVHIGSESIHLRALDRETYEVLQINRASLGPEHPPSDEQGWGDLSDLEAADDPRPPRDAKAATKFAAQTRRYFIGRKWPYKVVGVGPYHIGTLTDSGSRIDIMATYTRQAAAAASTLVDEHGHPFETITNIHVAIQHALDKVNFVAPFSGIATQFKLVHTVEVMDSEPNVSSGSMLVHLGEGDGKFEELIPLADQYRADITSLFIAGGSNFNACGIGSILAETVEPEEQVYTNGRGLHWYIG